MSYDFRGLGRFLWRWLRLPGWTLKRAGVVLAFLLIYPLHELLLWLGLALDRLFYPRLRRQPVDAPLFIVGNFRSGTTFIHRLIAKDPQFTSMALWEIMIAPSIVARRVLQGLGRFERLIGRPIGRLVGAIESQWHDRVVVHHISMTEPEEDDYLGLHIWSVFVAGLSSGLLDEARPYAFFDQQLPASRRRQIMRFYRGCVQRHLLAHGGRHRYLAKNPALSPKLASTLETFADAKIIHMVRNPLETVPSFVSMMRWSWDTIDTPTDRAALVDFAFQMAGHWYRYPLQQLAQRPENTYAIVRYDDLVADPAATIRGIYTRLELDIGPEYEQILRQEADRAREFSSRHAYDLQELGIDRERILTEFDDLFERFGFDRELGQ